MTRIPPVPSESSKDASPNETDPPRAAPTRRDFLQLAGTAAGAAWLSMYLPAIGAANLHAATAAKGLQSFETLSADEARVLRAIAARCYPSDGTPGAEEAGVIHFMDRALGTFWTHFHEPLQGGLAALAEQTQAVHGSSDFAALETGEQDALLTWFIAEQPYPTFIVNILCAAGMFGDPGHGGNRNKVGWSLIGFEDRHVWEPPFGYYDARFTESEGGEG